jgi:hypothetical protein
MPAKGFKAITVKDDLYFQLKRQANDENLSLNDYLFALINKRVSGRGGSNPPVGAILNKFFH